MMQVDKDKFRAVKTAMYDCLDSVMDLDGRKIVPPPVNEETMEMAVVTALMTVAQTWVKPNNVKFIIDSTVKIQI